MDEKWHPHQLNFFQKLKIEYKEEAEGELVVEKMVEDIMLFQKSMENKLTSVAFAQCLLLILNCFLLLVLSILCYV